VVKDMTKEKITGRKALKVRKAIPIEVGLH